MSSFFIKFPALIGASLLSLAAAAQTADAAAPLSRAEVIADLVVWQQSGLGAMHAGDDTANVFGADYRAAQARYEALRRAPEFAQLVERIAREHGEPVHMAAH